MTETEFINHEISIWGEDEIFDLIERGYTPVKLTDKTTGIAKWVWLLTCEQREFVLP
jgi:hypothetical protein